MSRFSSSPADALASEVQKRFLLWRQSAPRGLRRIPENLWNDAIQLSSTTTVYHVSRLLGLDYCQLKKRVIAAYGPGCPTLPGKNRGKVSIVGTSILSPSDERSSKACQSEKPSRLLSSRISPATAPTTRTSGGQRHQMESVNSSPSHQIRYGESVFLPMDGFVEASATPEPWSGPPLLAEIRSSTGCVLRLFSPDTGLIVRAFVQP
ncbi:MAG: hypothetical protein WA705_26015 [Candidatus Ozemobacteraceae bacterium]